MERGKPTKRLKQRSSISSFCKSPHRQSQLPTPDTSPASSNELNKPSATTPQRLTQLHLSNLGMATRTTIHCKTCQMQYNKIDPNDTKLHTQHHTSILHGPTFPRPLSTSRPITRIPNGGDLVVISRASSKELQKRGLQLLSTVDTALGAPHNNDRAAFF